MKSETLTVLDCMRSVLRAVPRQRPRAVVAEGNGGISAAFRSFSVSGCSKDARRYSMSAGDGQSEVYENHPDSTSALAAPLSGIEPDDTGAKGGPSFDKKMSLKRIQYRQHQLYDTLLPEPPLQLAQHRWASDTKAAKRLAPIGADASGRRSESRRETAGAGPSVGGEISDSFRATYRSRPFRPIDLAAQKAKIQALRYLLLPDVGKSHGLHVREDGWVSLRELVGFLSGFWCYLFIQVIASAPPLQLDGHCGISPSPRIRLWAICRCCI